MDSTLGLFSPADISSQFGCKRQALKVDVPEFGLFAVISIQLP
jgi:hypothetical protein